jgi:hypothetical protein
MPGSPTLLHRFEAWTPFSDRFRSGISLHSHTMYSKEYLGRLPTYIAKFPVGGYIIERELGRLHLYQHWNFDFNKIYWTPPLSPREAHKLETGQIERQLGLHAIVSLSDHDNIEAGTHLRMLEGTANAPIAVEWTVPFDDTVFHIGVHNLPAGSAMAWMEELRSFTAKPDGKKLRGILCGLDSEQSVLVVLNHPYWDAESVGPERHKLALRSFLRKFLLQVHAIEINGMRSRKENREVLQLGAVLGIPVISGGDRHGLEANAVLNLSPAATFEEFVEEVRREKRSEIILMPQYFEPLPLRLMENAWHALSDAPGEFGRGHWMTRVFIEQNGEAKMLSQFTGTRFHRVVDKFRWVISLLANPVLRPALRLPFLGHEEGGL